MSIGKRIRQRRLELKYKQSDLAKMLGVTSSAIANYENEISCPKEDILYKLFKYLECDANFLFQDEMKVATENAPFYLTEHQKKVIEAYINNPHMQEAVNKLLNIE